MIFKKIFAFFKKKNKVKKLPAPKQPDLLPYEEYKKLSYNEQEDQTENAITMNQQNENGNPENKLPKEFEYLRRLISHRLDKYFPSEREEEMPELPDPSTWDLPLGKFIEKNKEQINSDAAQLLLIGIIPHVRPDLFDSVIEPRLPDPRQSSTDFPFIGGVRGKNCRFFLPTGETALFLIAGDDLDRRLEVQKLFGAEHIFWEKKILWLEDMQHGEPSMHGRIIMSPDYTNLLTYGFHESPQFSISFPAKKIAPVKDSNQKPPTFNDLVIPDEVREQINELKSWLKYNERLMKDFKMEGRLKKGYRTLFYGPPGTGKTFTAEILGNDLKKEVFKIDLSMVVSKYIGETEKNLELLFARAEDKGWILFFDEADALFGKRTNVRDAHDKYANQEVSYLLQRIEDYNGLVILATNMKNNIDDAFIRRFNSILKFPFPDTSQRAQIWIKAFPENVLFGDDPETEDDHDEPGKSQAASRKVNIPEAVKKYELSGGNIMNVVHFASIKAVERLDKQKKGVKIKSPEYAGIEHDEKPILAREKLSTDTEPQLTIYLTDVLDGIKREMIKEGKPFSL